MVDPEPEPDVDSVMLAVVSVSTSPPDPPQPAIARIARTANMDRNLFTVLSFHVQGSSYEVTTKSFPYPVLI
jgi:hypothetical protein